MPVAFNTIFKRKHNIAIIASIHCKTAMGKGVADMIKNTQKFVKASFIYDDFLRIPILMKSFLHVCLLTTLFHLIGVMYYNK